MYDDHSELPRASARPYTRSRLLPPYRGVIAVDAKDFTGLPAIEHEVVSRAVPELLRLSLDRAGLAALWEDRKFSATTGDGYVIGCDPSLLPFVIHPWLYTLQEVLTEYNVHSLGAAPIRLRVSLHVGPLPDTGDEFGGNGTARNDTHRLLDSRPAKAVLAGSRSITQVVAVLSERCYQDAVASGYTGRHPDHFIEVPATVDGKRFAQQAWIYVPQPSGPLDDRHILGEAADEGAGPDVHPQARPDGVRDVVRTTNRAPRGNINTGTVHGGQSVANHHVAGDQVGGNKAGKVRGYQGDRVHGDKNQGRS
ncbi:hypothetical protein [Streptomyces lichenis]|uniref:Guanylate cyclase domain-containing protein n=1 Tax=Streptomyces lichenis TaxID=2306967 RepID=A0ABT0I726_9ACTN|nr:hypothetical protein [Streptomyces lichenis]MCK8677135.1 hypothetical protein [Streptomyces lichenis]